MAAVLAFHHTKQFGDVLADKFGNDPFVWVSPFLWSHCNARPRPATFGTGRLPPLVHGRDVVFFVTRFAAPDRIACDCVFVIERVVPIARAEARFPASHPVRHFHFDHGAQRNPFHRASVRTWIANPDLSFVLHPPMPIGSWIASHVRDTGIPVTEYFSTTRRKNVRVVTRDAQGLYRRAHRWTKRPGHASLSRLPLAGLRSVDLSYPSPDRLHWPRDDA